MSKFYPPKFEDKHFHCAICNVYAMQVWSKVYVQSLGSWIQTKFNASYCSHCQPYSYWYNGRLVIPNAIPVQAAHHDMPLSCLEDYNEAREIVSKSPKAAAALLRLTLQKLMIELGEKGKNINDDIGSLVKKGLPAEVIKALDICRVIGNNSVHPGEISIDDNPEITHSLFELINFIVENMISQPKKINTLFSSLPINQRKAIEKRDAVPDDNKKAP